MISWMRVWASALLGSLAILVVPANVIAALPSGIQAVHSVEGVQEYRLSNGLKVLLYPDPSKPTTTVNVTYLVGSRHEGYGETGMAHLLEHLIFKGTERNPKPDVEFSRRGFRNNGSTWFDRTNYYSTFEASEDNLRWALQWEADAMVNARIAREDLDSEMTVVRNEFENGKNDPVRVMFTRMLSLSFDWHNYGNATIGNRSDIENVAIANLRAFYKRYYQPDNAVLTISGQFDPQKTLIWVNQTFGTIPKPKRVLPKLWTVEPTQDGERSFVVRRKADLQLVLVGYKVPSARHPDSDALAAIDHILGNTPNGRLHQALVEQGFASEVFVYTPNTFDPGLIVFAAIVKKEQALQPVRDRLVQFVENTFESAATEAELTRFRQEAEVAFEHTFNDPEKFGVAVSESIAAGDWRLMFLARNNAQKVTSEQISAVAKKYFRRDNRVVGLFVPEDTPERATIAQAPTAAQRLKDFKPRAAVAPGEAFDPSPRNLDERTLRIHMGDLELALLPKKTRAESVHVAINLQWGDVATLKGQQIFGMLAEQMMTRGTPKFTRQQIADEFTRLKIVGGPFQFQTDKTHLADALDLVAHLMREANFPEKEFSLLKNELLTGLQAQLNDPSERSRDALSAHFNIYPEGDPRRYLTLSERIEGISSATLAQVKAHHHKFWGGARGEIAVIGDFDPIRVEKQLRQLFLNWHSQAPYERIIVTHRAVSPERIVVNTPDMENAVLRARLNFPMRDDHPDYPALLVASTILGGGSGLANRLIERLRQQDGLSYAVGARLDIPTYGNGAWLQLGALVAPQNARRAEKAVREELSRWQKDGITDKELKDAQNGLLQARSLQRAQDAIVAQGWLDHLDAQRSWVYSERIDQAIRALTYEQVNAAIKRHIDPSQLTVVIAGDKSKGLE